MPSERCQEWERGGPGFGKSAVAASFLIGDDSLASGSSPDSLRNVGNNLVIHRVFEKQTTP